MLQPPKKKLTKQEQNIKDATQMENMRPVFKTSSLGRDIPLAPTPSPKPIGKRVAEGVVVSKADEKKYASDFAYLKKK